MTRRDNSPLLGWPDNATYEGIYDALKWRYHPAVAAIMADDLLKAREYALKGAEVARRNRQLTERKAS